MNNHILIFLFVGLVFEFAKLFRLKKILLQNIEIQKKIFKLFKKEEISYTKKQNLIFKYSKKLFSNSLKILLFIIIISLILYLSNYLSSDFSVYLTSLFGVIEISIIYLIYNFIRKRISG